MTSATKINWLSLSKTQYNRHELYGNNPELLVETIRIKTILGGHTTYYFLNGQTEMIWLWKDDQIDSETNKDTPGFELRSKEAESLLAKTRERFSGVIGKPGVDTEKYQIETVTIVLSQ